MGSVPCEPFLVDCVLLSQGNIYIHSQSHESRPCSNTSSVSPFSLAPFFLQNRPTLGKPVQALITPSGGPLPRLKTPTIDLGSVYTNTASGLTSIPLLHLGHSDTDNRTESSNICLRCCRPRFNYLLLDDFKLGVQRSLRLNPNTNTQP
jgi:hypothetical protein